MLNISDSIPSGITHKPEEVLILTNFFIAEYSGEHRGAAKVKSSPAEYTLDAWLASEPLTICGGQAR